MEALRDILWVLLMLAGIGALGAATWLLLGLRQRLTGTLDSVNAATVSAQRAVRNIEQLSSEIVSSGLLQNAKGALASVSSGVERIDPLLNELTSTLNDARELLDNVGHTSTSARARIDDLAAMQKELHDLSSALADVATEIRDQRVGEKVGNVLSDTSILMADIGQLTGSATSVLEGGRPLVQNIGDVVASAKRGVKSIGRAANSVKDGVSAAVDTLRDDHPGHNGRN